MSQVRGAVTDVLRTEVLRMWQPEKIVQAELTKMEILESTRVEAAIKILVKAERMAQVAERMAQVKAERMYEVVHVQMEKSCLMVLAISFLKMVFPTDVLVVLVRQNHLGCKDLLN